MLADKLGGGVVFWVDAAKAHGYIVNMSNIGTGTEQFGPEVNPSDAAGTSQNMGSGYTNTQNIVKKFNALQSAITGPSGKESKLPPNFVWTTVSLKEMPYMPTGSSLPEKN